MEDSEGTVRQIGAFSEGINNLTVSLPHSAKPNPRLLHVLTSALSLFQSMLKDDEFFPEISVGSAEADGPENGTSGIWAGTADQGKEAQSQLFYVFIEAAQTIVHEVKNAGL